MFRTKGIILFFLAAFLIILACQKEELQVTAKSKYSTPDFAKVKASISQLSTNIKAKNNSFVLQFDESELHYDDIINSEERVAVMPVQIEGKSLKSHLLFINVNDSLRSVLATYKIDSTFSEMKWKGEIFISDIDGKPISKFYVNRTNVKIFYYQDITNHKTSIFNKGDCDHCPLSTCDWHCLNQVVVTNDPTAPDEPDSEYESEFVYIPFTAAFPGEDSEALETAEGWSGGGGDSSENQDDTCPKGYKKDGDECVLDSDPCDDIANVWSNALVKSKIDSLINWASGGRNLFNTVELGYSRYATGTMERHEGEPNGHKIDLPGSRTRMAYLHTHTCKNKEEPDGDDDIVVDLTWQIFSPQDLYEFYTMLTHAKYFRRDVGDVYSTVISCDGNFMVKFEGNLDEINSEKVRTWDREQARVNYIDEMLNNGNLVNGFLTWFNDNFPVKSGITFYQISNDGTKVEKLSLDENNETVSVECP